jgi:hypothetical protein
MSRFSRPTLVACICLFVVCLAAPATFAGASLDIHPSRCPNVANLGARPMMRVAIVADTDFVASQVDFTTLEMTRADGVGGSVTPIEGRLRFRIADVAAPAPSEECSTFGADGLYDMRAVFRQSEVVEQLRLGDVPENTVVELCVSGQTRDGSPFEACDQVIVVDFDNVKPTQFDGIGTRPLLRM